MNPSIAKTVILLATVVMIVIRAPHGRRSRSVKVARSHKSHLETLLLVLAWVGFFVPEPPRVCRRAVGVSETGTSSRL